MDRFFYKGSNKKIRLAVKELNWFITSTKVEQALAEKDDFDFSADEEGDPIDGEDLWHLLKTDQTRCEVKTYRPWWRWSKAVAKYKGGNVLWLNSRRLGSVPSIMGSISHEKIHQLDAAAVESFGHGSNSSQGKNNSAPYYFGFLIKNLYKMNYDRPS